MSDIYLVLALVGTFLAVLLVSFAFDATVTERRRAVRLLEAQVGGGGVGISANLREQDLQRSFAERALVPVVAGAGRIARRVTPIDTRKRIARKLMLAGNPAGWDAERVAAFKVIGLVGGFALGWGLTTVGGLSALASIVVITLLTFAGFMAPDGILDRKVSERQRDIRKSLADVLDLLTISVEAGLSLNAALAQVVKNFDGVLSQEIARMLQEVQQEPGRGTLQLPQGARHTKIGHGVPRRVGLQGSGDTGGAVHPLHEADAPGQDLAVAPVAGPRVGVAPIPLDQPW